MISMDIQPYGGPYQRTAITSNFCRLSPHQASVRYSH
jgi:hypothetical protein